MDHTFYFQKLYPLQNDLLKLLGTIETGFYLSGGTAASRGYLEHRFSDDLDFFVNDHPDFENWSARVISCLSQPEHWQCTITQKETRFLRLSIHRQSISLKMEFINDVPSHIGEITTHAQLGRIDSAENILANKLTALIGRDEPKDIADVWGFCCQQSLSIQQAISDANSKASGIFPADLARKLCSVTQEDWRLIRWIKKPEWITFRDELNQLGEKLLLL